MKANIVQVFPDKDTNVYLVKMFQIIEQRKTNPLVYCRTEYRKPNYVYNELHHIIPRSYCKYHHFDIDNSIDGTVRLKYAEHILVHVYLKQYFLEKADYDVAYANAKAIQYMCGKNKTYIDKVNGIDEAERQQILEILQKNKTDIIQAAKHQYATMDSMQKMAFSIRRSNSMKEHWQNMSVNEKAKFSEKIRQCKCNRTQEEIAQQVRRMLDTRANWSIEMKQQIAHNTAVVSARTWKSYTTEQYEQRKRNIAEGTKNAMTKINKDIWQKSRKAAAMTLSQTCKNRSIKRRKEIADNHRKFHIGSRAMSNDSTHHWRYVAIADFQKYLDNGYVFGNHVKEWKSQGMVKISPGHYGFS